MSAKINPAEISFALKQSDKVSEILSIDAVGDSQSTFEVENNIFTEGEAEVCIDYQNQHFCMLGVVTALNGDKLGFDCKDDESMKVRMFMQLLSIQRFKNNQAEKYPSIEGAAKVWVEDKAEAFAKAFE